MSGKVRASVLLNEGPEVVAAMALVLGNGGSLETAIRDIASSGPPESRRMFSEVVCLADTRVEADMRTSLNEAVSHIPEDASAYAMAVRMVVSASESRSTADRDRLVAEARKVALDGLKEAGRMYSGSLNAPCMIIFGMGIMIPMVLMTVLPMLGASGMFGASTLDPSILSLVTLVIIPAVMAAIMMSVRDRNPFRKTESLPFDPKMVVPLLAGIPLFVVLDMFLGLGTPLSLAVSMCAASALTFAASAKGFIASRRKLAQAKALKEAVFDMGNYLISGTSFEESFLSAILPHADCAEIARRFTTEVTICRGDFTSAIRGTIDTVSPELSGIYCEIYRASLKDIRESGRLALSLGRQLSDQDAVRAGIRADLKGMSDTMTGTAALFAPLVLGLSITILGPLSRISADVDTGGTSTVVSIYLVELAALISAMLSFINGEPGVNGALRRFLMLMPVSLTVFAIVSLMSI